MDEKKRNKKWGFQDFLKTFKSLDLFGQYVTFNHEREFTFKSIPGSVATILFVVLVAWSGLKRLPDVIGNKMLDLGEHSVHLNLNDHPSFKLQKFKYGFGFKKPLKPEYGKLFARHIQIIDSIKVEKEIPLVPCINQRWNTTSSEVTDTLECLDLKNFDL
jgi:hypothetical protein